MSEEAELGGPDGEWVESESEGRFSSAVIILGVELTVSDGEKKVLSSKCFKVIVNYMSLCFGKLSFLPALKHSKRVQMRETGS